MFRSAIIVGIFYALPTTQLLIFHQRVITYYIFSYRLLASFRGSSSPFCTYLSFSHLSTLVSFANEEKSHEEKSGNETSTRQQFKILGTKIFIFYRFFIGVGTRMLATITSCVLVQLFNSVLSTMSGATHATSCWDFGSVALSVSGVYW